MSSVKTVVLSFLFLFILLIVPATAEAARLSITPAAASFISGGVFTVSVILDTEGDLINTINITLEFPPDKLQVVSPSLGKSIIGVWTAPPSFNNGTGALSFQGGIPGGINVKNGLISTISFRAKKTGDAVLKFGSNSQVLAHDGRGIDVLVDSSNGVYTIVLPPPGGPIIASETHLDQTEWYSNQTVSLKWTLLPGAQYSYVLNRIPVEAPDNTPENERGSVVYRNLSDGTHYFHLKAAQGDTWGGTSHFAINIDTTPPAEFPVKIFPSARTISNNPIIQFETSDAASGVNYYEYAVIPLQSTAGLSADELFFSEVRSPQILELERGKYDILVRAYDHANNYTETIRRLRVMGPIMFAATSPWSFAVALIVIVILGFSAGRVREWYEKITRRPGGRIPLHVQEKLKELKKYQDKYKHLAILLAIGLSFFASAYTVHAQQTPELSPPFVSTVSRDITNSEIFYIGGKTDSGNVPVIIYLQNLQSGETQSVTVTSDNRGEWFYRHDEFLGSGAYLLWTQATYGELVSPPSPQIQMSVESAAIQFGASRISFEELYLIIIIILTLIILGLAGYIAYHFYHGRRHHGAFRKEIREAKEAVRAGFMEIERNINRELGALQEVGTGGLSQEAKIRETELIEDLAQIKKHIDKEIEDIEEIEYHS